MAELFSNNAIQLAMSTSIQAQMQKDRLLAEKEQLEVDIRFRAMEAAKDVLLNNAKALPTEQREVTPAMITAYADTLIDSIRADVDAVIAAHKAAEAAEE